MTKSLSMNEAAPSQIPIVYVVDDDPSLREALDSLFRSVGLQAKQFGSTAEFLEFKLPDVASCIVLDIRLPGVSGLEFQDQLAKANAQVPIIFMTGHGDIPMSVRAMKAGAVDFLAKPFRDQDMLDAVATGIARDRERRVRERAAFDLKAHFDTLTPREREVMGYVIAGLMNKQIAARVRLSEISVKIHRANMLKKMSAKSVADLVRMAETLNIPPTK
jgi:FixJ family two-component response regulator